MSDSAASLSSLRRRAGPMLAALAILTASPLASAGRTRGAATPPDATAPLPDPLAAGWQGAPVCERLHEDPRLRVLRCTFPPGAGHERHFHAPHFGYALAGGRVRIADGRGTREVELETGSSYASDGFAWHEIVNVGDSTIVYLIVEPRADAAEAPPAGEEPTAGEEPAVPEGRGEPALLLFRTGERRSGR